jgi:hypothetical protein
MAAMARWADVERIMAGLAEIEADGRAWRVRGKLVGWERPLGPRDLAELGAAAPRGAVLAARTDGEAGKQELLAADPDVYFTTSHFAGFPAILVRLNRISVGELRELLTDAWCVQAPKRLVKEHFPDR